MMGLCEMRRLARIKLKWVLPHRQRNQKEELGRVHERNFQNSRKFPRNFQFGYCSSSDNPSAYIEKGEKSKWLKLT